MEVTFLPRPPTEWDRLDPLQTEELLRTFEGFVRGRGASVWNTPAALRLAWAGRQSGEAAPWPHLIELVRWSHALLGVEALASVSVTWAAETQRQETLARYYAFYWCLYRSCLRHSREAWQDDAPRVVGVLHRLSLTFECLGRHATLQSGLLDLYGLVTHEADGRVPPAQVVYGTTYRSLMWGWFGEAAQGQLPPLSCQRPLPPKSDREELYLYLLDVALGRRYRKREDVVYEERQVVVEGRRYGTRAWIAVGKVQDFVHQSCRKELNWRMWSLLVAMRDQGHALVELIVAREEVEFPTLKPRRHLFSFQNGLYHADRNAFYPYEAAHLHLDPEDTAAQWFDQPVDPAWIADGDWHAIPTPLFQSILDYQNGHDVSSDRAAAQQCFDEAVELLRLVTRDLGAMIEGLATEAQRSEAPLGDRLAVMVEKYRDRLGLALDETEDWASKLRADPFPTRGPVLEISTPNGFPPEAQDWVYVLLGRLLHPLKQRDRWQVIPFFRGTAGTGKSTIADVAKSFFARTDVGVLSDNCEAKFGLQGLLHKFFWACTELKKTTSINQAEFQSMVSGEAVAVAVKNQTAAVVEWDAPGLLCGNESPGWMDAAGSIARRLVIFHFRRKVLERHSKPDLIDQLKARELAALLIKCNMAYLQKAASHGQQDLWSVLPAYFTLERRALQREMDPLIAALHDRTRFEIHAELAKAGPTPPAASFFVPFEELNAAYEDAFKQIRHTRYVDALTEEKYHSAFQDLGLEVVFDTREYGHEGPRCGKWITGMRAAHVEPKSDWGGTS